MKHRWNDVAQSLTLAIVLFFPSLYVHAAPDTDALVEGNSAFACDLYQQLRLTEGNLFFAPYSISTALAMTYAGARGNTKSQMAKTMRFPMGPKVHSAFAKLASRMTELQQSGDVTLNVANSLWPENDYPLLDGYLSLTKKYYGASITPVNYKTDAESARKAINGWVENKTQDKIKDILQPGILDSQTRLVLINAIYFKGNWETQFQARQTENAPFYITADKTVPVPMMWQEKTFGYADLDYFEILELPYKSHEMAMYIFLPKAKGADALKRLEADWSMANFHRWENSLSKMKVSVYLPKFKMASMFKLDKTLATMGMTDAFIDKANFAGMDGRAEGLYISAVLHKAFVEVNEQGTEAAAATSVVMGARGFSPEPPTFRADHPFLFLIEEKKSGSILFMGRVADPTKPGE